jgi:CRISPR-associated endoribonuclease Cas6
MTMLLSILIHLEAQAEAQLDQFTGRGVHGFWFNRWRDADAALGDELHDSSDVQPFTLSPLMGLPRGSRGTVQLKPGTPARFRVTTLTDALSEAVRTKWLEGLEGKAEVFIPEPKDEDPGVPWKVTRAEVEAEASYEASSKVHLMNSVPPREWRLDFLTPTTFHGSDGHLPFPLPDSLVNSWMRRWNAFAPIALPKEELLEWSRGKLVVSSYSLRTLPAREGERLRVGCVGSLTLRALEMPPYLRAAIDLLAHYASFCGSGSHTAQGMGQTRCLSRQ